MNKPIRLVVMLVSLLTILVSAVLMFNLWKSPVMVSHTGRAVSVYLRVGDCDPRGCLLYISGIEPGNIQVMTTKQRYVEYLRTTYQHADSDPWKPMHLWMDGEEVYSIYAIRPWSGGPEYLGNLEVVKWLSESTHKLLYLSADQKTYGIIEIPPEIWSGRQSLVPTFTFMDIYSAQ